MNAAGLMVFVLLFLTSVLAHADHLVTQKTTAEQQGCQLCNEGIDTIPELPQVQAPVDTRYSFLTAKITTVEFTLTQCVQLFLRAPPFIQ
jgi:hypothetical protein